MLTYASGMRHILRDENVTFGEYSDEEDEEEEEAAADHVVSLVESLRDRLDFTSGAYTLTKAVAIRHVTVNPVPFPRVGRLRFARLALYQYLAVEGPKQATALQVYCLLRSLGARMPHVLE